MTREEYLKENFKLSLERLNKKCTYFDNGDEDIAIDMAVQLRVLLHTTIDKEGKFISRSLLNMLELDNIGFMDTSCEGWENSSVFNCHFGDNFSGHNVCSLQYPKYAFFLNKIGKDKNITFKPLDKTSNKYLPLDKWLNKTICYINPTIKFSRYDIILIICNKDGGAHYEKKDSYITNDEYGNYSFLKDNNSSNLYIDGEKPISYNIPLYVIVRQIAFEVIKTLEPYCQSLCK